MQITLTLNGIKVTEDVAADMLLIDFVRAHGCKSVKRGCETSNCGLWKACRKKPRSSAALSRIRVQSSVASATRALS